MTEANESTPFPVPEKHSGAIRSARILLVDDEPTVLKVLGMSLRGLGYTVTVAVNGADGLRIAKDPAQGRIDVLITDMRMPDTTGSEFAKRVLEVVPTAKVIYISGLPPATVQEQDGIVPGVDHFLSKPVSITELRKTLAVLGF